jgi:hypothetical protein
VFLKKSEAPMIFRIYGIVFLKKKSENMSTKLWTGSTVIGSRVYGPLMKRGPFNLRWTREIIM